MAIGDNINDIKMIENSGIGVAMGNSWDKVKLKADYVTKSNEEEGVSEAIEKFCDIQYIKIDNLNCSRKGRK